MTKASVKILVVDDSKVMRRIICSFLSQMGYDEVLEASDANDALPDQTTGTWKNDLLKAIRRDPANRDLPFVMLTAEAQLGQIVAAFREGVQQYITKPFTAQYLEYIINRVVQY